jgi:hypothetical protein
MFWALGTCIERRRSIGHWALVLSAAEVLGIGYWVLGIGNRPHVLQLLNRVYVWQCPPYGIRIFSG